MRKKIPAHALSDEALALIAARFKLLAEPMRLRLLHALEERERTVGQLVALTHTTQANVSKHLALLGEAGMVGRRKEGLRVYYRITDPVIFQVCDLMCNTLQRELRQKAAHFD